MVGHGGSSAGSYLADPTSPIPSHCASIVVTSTSRVKQHKTKSPLIPLFIVSAIMQPHPIVIENITIYYTCYSSLNRNISHYIQVCLQYIAVLQAHCKTFMLLCNITISTGMNVALLY